MSDSLPANYIDLEELISWDGFSFRNYTEGEENIIKPQLEKLGYYNISFSMEDSDSFGPLVRGVRMCKGGLVFVSSYG